MILLSRHHYKPAEVIVIGAGILLYGIFDFATSVKLRLFSEKVEATVETIEKDGKKRSVLVSFVKDGEKFENIPLAERNSLVREGDSIAVYIRKNGKSVSLAKILPSFGWMLLGGLALLIGISSYGVLERL